MRGVVGAADVAPTLELPAHTADRDQRHWRMVVFVGISHAASKQDHRMIQEVSIAYFGTARLDQAGLPDYRFLSATQPTRGYVAVSLRQLNLDYRKNGSFAWLKSYQPIERIGKSINLFYIP